jgi:hypothetical protein
MTKYLLSVYQPTGAEPPPPDVLDKIMQDVAAWENELKAAGAWVFTGRLHAPATATVLQQSGDDVLMTDGPFTEGKEYIAGFTIIQAPDLDAALGWGRKFSRVVPLPLEVRPMLDDDES